MLCRYLSLLITSGFCIFEILKPKTCSFWFLEKRKEKKSLNQRTGDFHERANKEL